MSALPHPRSMAEGLADFTRFVAHFRTALNPRDVLGVLSTLVDAKVDDDITDTLLSAMGDIEERAEEIDDELDDSNYLVSTGASL